MEIVTEKTSIKGVPEGYKRTEIGVIPKDWEEKKFSEAIKVVGGGAFSSSDSSESGIKWLKIANVRVNSISWKEKSYLPENLISSNTKFLLKEGDYVVALTRPILDRKLKIAQLNKEDSPALLNQRVGKIDSLGGFDIKFISYSLQKDRIIDSLLKSMAGTDPPNLSIKDLYAISFATPPTLEEQQAISESLSDVDALIAELDALIEKKKQIKKGAMQQLLTGKKRLPGFDGEWEEKKLGELVIRNELGGNYSNSKNKTDFPLIKMGNLDRGIINLDDLHYASNPSEVSKRDRLNYGDLLFNTRNTPKLVGKVAVWRNELPKAYYNSNLMKLEFDENYIASNFFMNYTMNTESFIEKLKSIATGTTSVAAIYTRDLFTLNISVPPKEEQKAIARMLSDMDAEIKALQGKRSKYEKIKQGMMQELLTGKTRLV